MLRRRIFLKQLRRYGEEPAAGGNGRQSSGELQDTDRGSRNAIEGPNASYGSWWRVLNFEHRGPEFEPVMALPREHTLARVNVQPGSRVLGHVVERRRMYSVRSAAIEFNCDPPRLRRMLTVAGVLPPDRQRRRDALAVFDADLAAPVLATIGDRMPGAEVRTLLGVKNLRPFMREGLLVPLNGDAGPEQRLYDFSRPAVERFLHAMTHRTTEVDEAELGQMGLYESVTAMKRSVGEIAKVIRDGRATRVYRLRGSYGLPALLVDLDELKGLMRDRSHGGLPVSDLHLHLRTRSSVVVGLIERGAIIAEMVVSDLTRRSRRMVTPERLAEYEATYVLLFTLTHELGVGPQRLRSDLNRRGVRPAFPPNEVGASVYLRSEV